MTSFFLLAGKKVQKSVDSQDFTNFCKSRKFFRLIVCVLFTNNSFIYSENKNSKKDFFAYLININIGLARTVYVILCVTLIKI